MFSDFKELLDRASGPADMATILIFGTLGFVVDAGLSVHGVLSPGTVGIASASGALGLKKSVEASVRKTKTTRDEKSVPAKAESMIALLKARGQHGAATRLQDQLELYKKKIVDEKTLESQIKIAADTYTAAAYAGPVPDGQPAPLAASVPSPTPT